MGLISHVNRYEPVMPRPVLESLRMNGKGDSLALQREEVLDILHECYAIYASYAQNQHHDDIHIDLVPWALARTDHTTLKQNRSENRDWMKRLSEEAVSPFPVRSICTYPDKIMPVVRALKPHPNIAIACVTGFPHSAFSAKQAYQEIKDYAEKTDGITNARDVDTVCHYLAWMNGEHDLFEDILRAESEAAAEFGMTWKPILKISTDAYAAKNIEYGSDCFRSIYDKTRLICSYGGNPKTSTGQAAHAPYNDFTKKDVGHIALALMMMVATRDYNAEESPKAKLWNKFSGGHESEADIAVFRHAAKRIYPDMQDSIVFGANYELRKRLLMFRAEQMGDDLDFDRKYLGEYGFNRAALPASLTGLPRPHHKQGCTPAAAPHSPHIIDGPV